MIKQMGVMLGLVAGLSLSGIAGAQGYQWEVGYLTSTEEGDVSNDEFEISFLFATYYFDQVDVGKGPLAEAEFLSRASNLSAALVNVTIPFGVDVDGDGFVLEGKYYAPGQDFLLGLTAQKISLDSTIVNGPVSGDEIDDTTFTAGIYLDATSAVSLNISSGSTIGFDTSGFGVDYKALIKAGSNHVNLEVGYLSEDFDTTPAGGTEENTKTTSVSGDYYINNQFSVGAGFSSISADDVSEEGTAFSLDLVYFFTPMVALEVELEEFSADNVTGEDSSTLGFALIGRF